MLPRFIPRLVGTPAGEALLREAQRKDLASLCAIVNESGVNQFLTIPAPVLVKTTTEHYRDNKKSGKAWVACILGGKVVGSILLSRKCGRESHVAEFGIAFSKKAHGRGIAEASINYCFSWLKGKGIRKVAGSVHADNRRARAFYRKVGFKELCALRGQVRCGKRYLDSVIIEKFL